MNRKKERSPPKMETVPIDRGLKTFLIGWFVVLLVLLSLVFASSHIKIMTLEYNHSSCEVFSTGTHMVSFCKTKEMR